jgi:DNA-binding CsgD family transcriptional regulator
MTPRDDSSMARGHAAVLNAVEAAYDVGASAWLERLVEELAPSLDAGVGVQGLAARFTPTDRILAAPVLVGGTDAWRSQWLENWWTPVVERVDATALRSMLEFGGVSSAQQLWDAAARGIPTLDAHLKVLAEHGWASAFRRPGVSHRLFYPDSLNLCAVDASGHGVAIVANREEVLRRVDLQQARRRFAPLTAHLATALRARARLGGRAPRPEDGEAVLTPGGALVHATGAARDPGARHALRNAARDIDRARAHALDEADALALWRCLVEHRWTLLDEFESDGRRYVVAIPNAPREPTEALSERESQVVAQVGRGLSNKEIGYLLGLAPSTVATLVARASKKLGVGSRVALVRRARLLRPEAPPSGVHEMPAGLGGTRRAS